MKAARGRCGIYAAGFCWQAQESGRAFGWREKSSADLKRLRIEWYFPLAQAKLLQQQRVFSLTCKCAIKCHECQFCTLSECGEISVHPSLRRSGGALGQPAQQGFNLSGFVHPSNLSRRNPAVVNLPALLLA